MLLRASLLGLLLSSFVIVTGACSACTAPPAEGEGEGEGAGEGEGEGAGEGEGEGAGEGEGEGAGEGEGEGAGEGEGEGEGAPVTERLIDGGGAGDGPIAGTLFVHVIDSVTLAPVADAFVRIDFAASNTELTSDAGGLATFTSAELTGAVAITVHGAGLVTETWLGVNATNVTIPVAVAGSFTAPPSGTLDVNITNIAALTPANGADYFAVVASVSSLKDLGNAANAIDDGGIRCTTRLAAINNGCDGGFTMQSRVGTLTVMATILGVRDSGVPGDPSDDTLVGVQTYAVARGVVVLEGQTTGVNLTILNDNQLATADVSFPNTTPTGLAAVSSIVTIDVGDQGLATVDAPFTLNRTSQPVPALAGLFAGDSYEILAVADPAGTSSNLRAQSVSIQYGQTDITGGINLPEWLLPPDNLTVSDAGLTLAYAPPATQSFASIDIRHGGLNPALDGVVWNVGVFDNRSTVSLPNLSDNPIPAGQNGVVVFSAELPAFDANNFAIQDLGTTISRASRAVTTFTK